MKYKNFIHKIKKNWKQLHRNSNQIKYQKDINQKNKDNFKNISYYFLKSIQSYNTEWENLERYTDGEFYSLYYCWYKNYEFELKNFPIKILPYIDIKFLHRDLTSENSTQNQIWDSPIINYSYLVENEEEINGEIQFVDVILKVTVTINANLRGRDEELSHQIQGKLLINLINPEIFI